jgi:hypothetical protein
MIARGRKCIVFCAQVMLYTHARSPAISRISHDVMAMALGAPIMCHQDLLARLTEVKSWDILLLAPNVTLILDYSARTHFECSRKRTLTVSVLVDHNEAA